MIKVLLIAVMVSMSSFAYAQDNFGSSASEEPQEYIKILNEVPLMDNLYEVTDSAIFFDKPDGRIAEVIYFSDSLSIDDVKSYYIETLPQLGWSRTDETSESILAYRREQEIFTIMISKSDGELVVKFNIFPYENRLNK